MHVQRRKKALGPGGRVTRASIVAIVVAMSMVAAISPTAAAQEGPALVATTNPVLVDGGPIAGSTNGMFFDADNNLWVASVFGRTITKIDPETGEILETLDESDGVLTPDDLTFGPDGTMYWTEIITSSVNKRTPEGETVVLVEPGGLQNANPITLSDDGRLFAAGCYAPSVGIFEIDPVEGGIINTVRDGDPGCASNAMDFLGDTLFSPRPFEDRVVSVDVDTGELTDVTTDWATPIAVKFNSEGELFAGAQGTGEVIRIDLDNPDVTANREVIATFPVGWIDNLAFDENDRLYVSSASDGGIVEILDDGEVRTVIPGVFTLPNGLGLFGDEIVTANSAQLLSFDKRSGNLNSVFRSAAGVGTLPFMTSVSTAGDHVVGMDFFFGELALIDRSTGTRAASAPMDGPLDALEHRGDLLVTDIATNTVQLVDIDDLAQRTTVAELPVPTGMTGDDNDVYVASLVTGQILQIIADGAVLEAPAVIATDLAAPEGITMHNGGTSILVVEGATGSLTQIDIATGNKQTVAAGLDLYSGNAILPFGAFNDVESDGEAIFVSVDRGNAILRFETCAGMTESQALAAGYTIDDRSAATSGQTITGGAGPDWIIGSESKDVIRGKAGGDAICSRGGRDMVAGDWGPDYIDGGQERDFLRGGRGNDTIIGGHGWDFLFGGHGMDVLDGGLGRDHLRGGRGSDTLTGGLSADRMWGGLGLDLCIDITNADSARSCQSAS